MILPPKDRSLPLHLSNLLSKVSSSRDQSHLFNLPALIGIPRYFTDNFSSSQPKTSKIKFRDVLTSPRNINELFQKLILSLDQTSNQHNKHFIIITSLGSSLPKIRVSSAYCMLINVAGDEPHKSFINPALSAFLISLFNPSAKSTKSNDDNRSPYYNPYCKLSLFQAHHSLRLVP